MIVRRRRALTAAAMLFALALAACGSDPNDSAGGSADDGSNAVAVVTFEVPGGEQFKVELVTQAQVDNARKLLAGEEAPSIPIGTVVRDTPGVNAPWTWHLDPTTLEFADFAIGVCDGLPSGVEKGIITSDQYCPWSAKVIALDEK